MAEGVGKWAKAAGLSAWQWQVVLLAPFVLALTWLRLRTGGCGKTLAAAQAASVSRISPEAQLALARDTAYALAVAIKYGPWRPQCLLRSLALAWFLGRKGIPFEVRIGVAGGTSTLPPAGKLDFTAHAWVEHAGVVLNDQDKVAQGFSVFGSLPGRVGGGAQQGGDGTQPFLPAGRRLYCIGDIHGRLDLLQELHDLIRTDAAGLAGSKGVVYLGDYIDRGAQSRQVLDLLIGQTMQGFDAVHLLGNHEQAMLDFLDDPQAAAVWLDFGGQTTLLSYGVGLGRIHLQQQVDLLRDELELKLPESHREFIANCRLLHIEGSYCFVHAGIRPGVPPEKQTAADLLWTRDEFTRSEVDHGHIVVHGHSIREDVDWRSNRIGIDTGAYHSGVLTALVLEGKEQRVLQTGRDVNRT